MDLEATYDFDLFSLGKGLGALAVAKLGAMSNLRTGYANFSLGKNANINQNISLQNFWNNDSKKLNYFVTQLGDLQEDQRDCGFESATDLKHNWTDIVQKLEELSDESQKEMQKGIFEGKIKVLDGNAKLISGNSIEVTRPDFTKVIVSAKLIIVTLEERSIESTISGAKEYTITENDVFRLKKSPGKCMVVGLTPSMLETAGFLRNLGYLVTLLQEGDSIQGLDKEMISKIMNYMQNYSFIKFVKGKACEFKKESDKIRVTWIDVSGKTESELFDTICLGEQRILDYSDLGLETVGKMPKSVDSLSHQEVKGLSSDSIHVVDGLNSQGIRRAEIAIKHAYSLISQLAKGVWEYENLNAIPITLYTPLQYSYCGLTEEQAIEAMGVDNIDIYFANFKALEWNFNDRKKDKKGYIKVVLERNKDQILGIHYFGPNASEVVQGFSIVVRKSLGMSALTDTIGIHPTTAEEMVNIKNKKRDIDLNEEEETGC